MFLFPLGRLFVVVLWGGVLLVLGFFTFGAGIIRIH